MDNGRDDVSDNDWRKVREKEFDERQYLENMILEKFEMEESLEEFSLRISPEGERIENMKTIELIDGRDYDSASRGYFIVDASVPRNETLELCRKKKKELGAHRGDVINESSFTRPGERKHTGPVFLYWQDVRKRGLINFYWVKERDGLYHKVSFPNLSKNKKAKK